MTSTHEHKPGDPAPETGHYQELNVFGSHTGKVAHVTEGEPLPRSPRGFAWRLVIQDGIGELDKANRRIETPAELRSRAARARLLARGLLLDEAGPRLLAFAEELGARADAMESTER